SVANADDHAGQFCDNANNSHGRYAGVRSSASANANRSQDRDDSRLALNSLNLAKALEPFPQRFQRAMLRSAAGGQK
ncbi:MAG TPA: hypothetical protein VJ790_07050, partial [Dongiaceae bacterium]|nr:hypothetical protein [Dongiaceae bacterium]